MSIAVFTLDAELLARSQYSESPATGHLDTGFSWFPCVYKQILRWFPTFQVATTCFSCSPPDLTLLDPYFIFVYVHNNHCHRATTQLQLHIYYYYLLYFDVSTFRSMCAVPNMGVFCSSLTSCFPGMLLMYFLNS